MRISVFGLGYVGTVSAACLAEQGHTVVGVDANPVKVEIIAAGRTPVIEDRVDDLVRAAVSSGRLRATTDVTSAVSDTDMALLCVGTPSQPNGDLDLSYLERVSHEVGAALRHVDRFFVVAVRSTVLPGTTRNVVIPALEAASGRRAGVDFGVCVNPEFLREGSAVEDYYAPPKVVIGALDETSRERFTAVATTSACPVIQTDIELAEIVKYADNSWHALKVAFANEIGALSKAYGIDGSRVMEVFCADEKLNLSSSYLRPGFAFGGSCLPKDVRALAYGARTLDLDVPLLQSVLPSNRSHLDRALQLVMATGHRRIAILGLSFKAGTDDLRESPMVEIVERLIGKGYDLRVYDSNVNLASLVGANRDFILNQVPHISQLLVPTLDDALAHGETVVVGNGDPEFHGVAQRLRPEQRSIELVRLPGSTSTDRARDGICW